MPYYSVILMLKAPLTVYCLVRKHVGVIWQLLFLSYDGLLLILLELLVAVLQNYLGDFV